MSEIKNYKDLKVWQKAMDVTVDIYKLVKKLPKEETYLLSDQMRRSAVSIPSNIAEGQARSTAKEYARFLSIAMGSKSELETQLMICARIGYFSEADISQPMSMLTEIGKMLNKLASGLRDDKVAEVKK